MSATEGTYFSVAEIQQRHKAEGFNPNQVEGKDLRRQLLELIKYATTKNFGRLVVLCHNQFYHFTFLAGAHNVLSALGITIDDMEPEWGGVQEIIYDAMRDVLGEELEHWKIFAVMRERREGKKTLP